MGTNAVPMEQLKQAMKATWMAGDFGVIARNMAEGSAAFVDRLPIHAGERAVDVACGTGNTAIPLARRGLSVTGVDIATNLLAQAKERAAAEGLAMQFDEGDAEALPYDEASFDVGVTMYGAMFAPQPEKVASEFGRVIKPGGLLAMANWNPESFPGQMFKMSSKHLPPPAGLQPPVLWGDPDTVHKRLEPYFTDIRTELEPVIFDFALPPEKVVALFRDYFGPAKMTFARLDAAGQEALAKDFLELWTGANESKDPQRTVITSTHLRVLARRR